MKAYKYRFFRIKLIKPAGVALLLSLLGSITFAEADDGDYPESRIRPDWRKVSNAELDALRGGFALANGMVVDFSFEKIIYRNGVESFSSYLKLPENIPLIQNGSLNFAADLTHSMLNSVIQNNLDNQVIRTVNTINIDISNLKNINHDMAGAFRNYILPTMVK
ncbi:hypothetical protein Q9L42_014860 [Methylomarinum sp. Ch1-1]|uniref:Uncharacterized protein n=1 Tax=Methylomarinum roseum TaxID=3067653 RepID=A0AAU7NRK8_9GAMM|nr:hypothetical protein [Methylomarinum sp. Ch1-1]MDP4520394.1 hypothetical protein [Methylomarinum sp. Ch1-1]